MSQQPPLDYRPGANVHPTQARLGLTAMDRWRPVNIAGIGTTTVDLTLDGITATYRCDHAPRLRELVASGRA